ncbi:MAG: hypothetical protein JXQ73_04015 [Phycisphaerae bacterium]|nr:hypothetical protein [Phycisphaerae bacterium]
MLELDADAPPWMATFMDRYQKLGAQLADASLVYLAEREGIETVFTLDRRDFLVYRVRGDKTLNLIPTP